MAGLLADVYSFGNRTRNKLRGLLDDPIGTIQQAADATAEGVRNLTGQNETAQQFALRDRINAGDKNALAEYKRLGQVSQNKLFDLATNFNPAAAGVVVPKLSKIGDPRDAAGNLKQVMSNEGGQMPYKDIAQMTRDEFAQFYEYIAPHHQGKFDRLLRQYAPQYDDLPKTMSDYAKDFSYENPGLVRQFGRVKPSDEVTIYRGVTKADPDTTIMPGDWVALERRYAQGHGNLGDDPSRLMKMKVPAKDIRWAGTSADEYFYVPSESVDQAVGSKYDALQKYANGLLK